MIFSENRNMKTDGSSFRFDKETVKRAAMKGLKHIAAIRLQMRENCITERMSKRRFWVFGRKWTRDEATVWADSPTPDIFDDHRVWLWSYGAEEDKATNLIEICDKSQDDFVLLGYKHAADVVRWDKYKD